MDRQTIKLNVCTRRIGKTRDLKDKFKELKNSLDYRFACLIIAPSANRLRAFYDILEDTGGAVVVLRTFEDLNFEKNEQGIFDYVLIDDYFDTTPIQRKRINEIIYGFSETNAIAWGTPNRAYLRKDIEVSKIMESGNAPASIKAEYEKLKAVKPEIHADLMHSFLVNPQAIVTTWSIDRGSVSLYYDKKTIDALRRNEEKFRVEILGEFFKDEETIFSV